MGGSRFDTNLRLGAGHELKLPFTPVLAFAAKDGSFTRNLEQCNGCGGCRKETPTMCPTFIATGEEIMSTRGRANAIRAALELRGVANGDPLRCAELEAALSNCLSCKACTTECPSNVNMALLKAELLQRADSPRRLVLARAAGQFGGFAGQARLPHAPAGQRRAGLAVRARHPDEDRSASPGSGRCRITPGSVSTVGSRAGSARRRRPRGRVVLWDDTFVRYHEPHIGMAAVKVLEAAGFEVALPAGRKCCGRPAFSQGNLEEATRLGQHNLALLNQDVDGAPILFLEPSCYSMFVEDYRELKLEGAEQRRQALLPLRAVHRGIAQPGAGGAQVQGQSGERRHPRALPCQGADEPRLHAEARRAAAANAT